MGGSYERPQLASRSRRTRKPAGGDEASERLSQYAVDASGVYHLLQLKVGARARPYVIGGAGYLRQVHEGRLRLETGDTDARWRRRQLLGCGRLESTDERRLRRARRRDASSIVLAAIEFEDKGRTFPSLASSAFWRFWTAARGTGTWRDSSWRTMIKVYVPRFLQDTHDAHLRALTASPSTA